MSSGQRGHYLARRRRGARWVSAGGGGPARRAPAAGRRDRPAAADLGSVLPATPLQKSKWGEWGSTIKGGQTQKGSPMGFRRGRGGRPAGPRRPGIGIGRRRPTWDPFSLPPPCKNLSGVSGARCDDRSHPGKSVRLWESSGRRGRRSPVPRLVFSPCQV